jgi:hypothetical protein
MKCICYPYGRIKIKGTVTELGNRNNRLQDILVEWYEV